MEATAGAYLETPTALIRQLPYFFRFFINDIIAATKYIIAVMKDIASIIFILFFRINYIVQYSCFMPIVFQVK